MYQNCTVLKNHILLITVVVIINHVYKLDSTFLDYICEAVWNTSIL